MSCNCGTPNPTTSCVCGTFTDPVNPDQGVGWPLKRTISCEAPTLPVIECSDPNYTTVFDPTNESAPFSVLASLFDENCLLVTDQDGAPIILTIT